MIQTALSRVSLEMALAISSSQILDQMKGLLVGALGFAGGALVVFAIITIAANLSEATSGNGASIARGVVFLVGGVMISVAAIYFGQLDTSWAN